MISGFSSSSKFDNTPHGANQGGGHLPIPFNIPNVLKNLLFEDIGLEFDAKQSDLVEAVSFSYKALSRMQEKYTLKNRDTRVKMMREPNNPQHKEDLEEMQLDLLQANHHFKDLVIVMAELLTREQYAILMKFSNIPV